PISKWGPSAILVCQTCTSCGRHPASDTGLEHAVAAPNTSANSSIIAQFSGPLSPLPADTTISASGRVILSVARTISCTIVPKSDSAKLGTKSTICALPDTCLAGYTLGLIVNTLVAA